jgi:antitoxin ParD1/3/4
MARRTTSPISGTLPSGQKAFVEDRVRTGRFASASEVVREGLRALEREEAHLDSWMREKIRAARDDPRPSVPADEVLARLNARIATADEDR